MARFIYHGPVQSVALAVARPKDRNGKEIETDKDGNDIPRFKEIDLHPGKETPDLPDDNPVIKALIARNLLRPVDAKDATEVVAKDPAKPVGKPAKADAASAPEPKGEK